MRLDDANQEVSKHCPLVLREGSNKGVLSIDNARTKPSADFEPDRA